MLICSFACMFILGSQNLSAQYVPADEATVIVKGEIANLMQVQPVLGQTLSGVTAQPMAVRAKRAFLTLVLENLNNGTNPEVEGSINLAYSTMTSNVASREALVLAAKTFTEGLLED